MSSSDTPGRHSTSGSLGSTLISVVFIAVLVVSVLRAFDWNPASFLHVGKDLPGTASYVEERLPDVPTFSGPGHDGKYFFVQAHDPLLLDPARHAVAIDRPAYRYQRFLYPILASPALIFGDRGLAWALIAVNL